MTKLVSIILSGALALGAGVGVHATTNSPAPVADETRAQAAANQLSLVDADPITVEEEASEIVEETSTTTTLVDADTAPEESEEDDDNLSVEERIKRNSESDDVWYHIEPEECPCHEWENIYEEDDAGVYHYSRCCLVCGAVEDLDYCPDDLAWTKQFYRTTAPEPEEEEPVEDEEEPTTDDVLVDNSEDVYD